MAKRISLREFQQRVTQRLQAAGKGAGRPSRLGVRIGNRHYLLDLTDVSEVVAVPPVLPVPLTHDWYRGVTNIRGTLYSVADLSLILGQPATVISLNTRLMLIHPKLMENAALLVTQMIGLRQPEQLQLVTIENQEAPQTWLGDCYRDEQGIIWQSFSLPAFVRATEFQQVNRYQ